jgi:division protein CdvB (Snf7/Vps24/ESCRT-III family)
MSEERQYNRTQFRQEDIARLKQLVNEGCQVLQEVEDLNGGLKETVKSIAEEMDLKPAQLNKAIRVAYKASLQEEKDKLTEIEDILDAVGRK